MDETKKAFLDSPTIYVATNINLAMINFLLYPKELLFHWISLLWSIGLTFYFVFSRERFVISDWEEKVAKIEMRARQKKSP